MASKIYLIHTFWDEEFKVVGDDVLKHYLKLGYVKYYYEIGEVKWN